LAGLLIGGYVEAVFQDDPRDLAKERQRLLTRGLSPEAVYVKLAKPGFRKGVRRQTRQPAEMFRRFQALFDRLWGKVSPLCHPLITPELEELLFRTLPLIETSYLIGKVSSHWVSKL
jgi:hypothetical protein